MGSRIEFSKASPEAYQAMLAVSKYTNECGLEHSLLELVKTRASQINGCAFCLQMHTRDARKLGETEERLRLLSAWREAPIDTTRVHFEAAGVQGVDVTRGPHFNHASLGLDAAIDGMGVVLGYPVLASADVVAGKLVMPFDLSVPLAYAYYLVCSESNAGQPAIAAFRNWITAEARAG